MPTLTVIGASAATPRAVTLLRVQSGGAGGALVLPARVTAREEVTSLLRQLKLPLDERGRRREVGIEAVLNRAISNRDC